MHDAPPWVNNHVSHWDGFRSARAQMATDLLATDALPPTSWQSTDVSASKLHATHELMDVTFWYQMPTIEALAKEAIRPNLPWAEMHFQERVSGDPLNPPPSHTLWPWSRHNADHQTDTQFSHTYPERMWPREAGMGPDHNASLRSFGNLGIRFRYGDLNDVVNLMANEPATRQAFLPIWFPEDTGRHHGQRVPCTLGYHFMIRRDTLSVRYYIRSCDLVRHFADDVYMAVRLAHWMQGHLINRGVTVNNVGYLTMYISSLHAFVGDRFTLEKFTTEGR